MKPDLRISMTYPRKMALVEKERGPRECPCPRCGEAALYRFLDDKHTQVEVSCTECGQFQMPRETFDHAASDIIEPEDRE
jgi:predicted RNA-binding Zn-ribbon protein involved in translation (DUF1610 family)